MCAVRIRSHFRINEGTPHDVRDTVYERVMNATVRYMNDAMGARFKQSELGGTQATTDSESSAMAKSGSWPGNELHRRQAVSPRQLIQRGARIQSDARLAETWAAGARRPVRTDLQQSFTDSLNPPSTVCSPPF
jgi:hypothetical protein